MPENTTERHHIDPRVMLFNPRAASQKCSFPRPKDMKDEEIDTKHLT